MEGLSGQQKSFYKAIIVKVHFRRYLPAFQSLSPGRKKGKGKRKDILGPILTTSQCTNLPSPLISFIFDVHPVETSLVSRDSG